MLPIIDRRQQGSKSHGQVERFKNRYSRHMRQAAKDALEKTGITGDTKGIDVHIPAGDMSQPVFSHGSGGTREIVRPGNKEYIKGDRIPKPSGGAGQNGKGDGEGQSDLVYHMSPKEVEDIWFGDLALPLSLREHVISDRVKIHRAGVVKSGTSNNRIIVRTFRAAMARRIVQNANIKSELKKLADDFESAASQEQRDDIAMQIDRMSKRRAPFLDPLDERFRNLVKEPVKETRAVMFALMDVSQSMDKDAKYMSRLYFMFLYRFLRRHYERVDFVPIRYHSTARICETVDDFFNGTDTGGTSVTNALDLMDETVQAKYNPAEWDVFGAQAGDGDTGVREDDKIKIALDQIMVYCQYFTNLVIAPKNKTKELTTLYNVIGRNYGSKFASRQASQPRDILPVFREMFKAKTGEQLTQMVEQTDHIHHFGMREAAP